MDGFVKDMMELVRVSHESNSVFDAHMSKVFLKSGRSSLLFI